MPKIVDHEQYRAELLDRAFEFFARHGFAAVTMRKLAAELGVSTGTLYHYFASKEELFEQTADRIADTNLGALLRAIDQAKDLAERFDLLCLFVNEQQELLWNGLALLIEFRRIAGGSAAQRALTGYRRAIRASFRELPDSASDLLFSALVGFAIERGLDPAAAAPATRLSGLRDLLMARGAD